MFASITMFFSTLTVATSFMVEQFLMIKPSFLDDSPSLRARHSTFKGGANSVEDSLLGYNLNG